MATKISSLLSRLSQFSWLFFPPLILLSVLAGLYALQSELFHHWLVDVPWLSVVSLGIAAAIALQFGRSRLVYACVLLVVIIVQPIYQLPANYQETWFITLALCLFSLLFTKDKGFSIQNLSKSLGLFIAIGLFAWQILPSLQSISQPWLSKLTRLLFNLAPEWLSLASSFTLALLFVLCFMGLIRLMIRPDNTHNALLFALFTAIVLHLSTDPNLTLIGLIALSVLFCFAILKDSFTMAYKDELTGIPSRRALMQYVQTLGRKYTVVMTDIDHFKKFNDTYGHDVGDEVLKLVASKLSKVQGGGKTFRFGGEEFIIVFARKNTAEVAPFVEIVRQTIADYDVALRTKPRPAKPKNTKPQKPAKDKIVKVTSSFGIAQRTKQHSEFADIMKQADIALYAAKKAGRNCVKVAQQ